MTHPIRWTSMTSKWLTGVITIDGTDAVIDLQPKYDRRDRKHFYMLVIQVPLKRWPARQQVEAPLHKALKPLLGKTLRIDGVTTAPLEDAMMSERMEEGMAIPRDAAYASRYCLRALMSVEKAEIIRVAAGGRSDAEIRELNRLADAGRMGEFRALLKKTDRRD